MSTEHLTLETGISFAVQKLNARDPQNPPSAATPSQSSASITGTLSDQNSVALSGVRVTLFEQNGAQNNASSEPSNIAVNRSATTDSRGAFAFTDLPPGTYQLKVDAPGIEPFVSEDVSLAAGETRELPVTAIRMARKTTTVRVVATTQQVAQAQMHEEEQQRILGVLPNFLTSYIWDAAPLTPKLKYRLAFRTIIDPVTLLVTAGVAGAEQYHNTFPGYGQEAEGYGKRFGATYADTVANRMISFALLPSVFHQDPRYFYRGSGSIRSRILYAVASSVICRGDNGQSELNYSKIIGAFATAGLSNIYRAPQDRQASLTFRNGLIIIAGGAAVNLMREFISRKLTPNVPGFAKGKP
ncbi:MAG TPA: carboxypeptidase-like regulatory domain-containing protein [Bryobacteraceae bacterium]|nr:carboxypeptidase-like regulatory domain-containing protein [Bryobacteraceae bacterium]